MSGSSLFSRTEDSHRADRVCRLVGPSTRRFGVSKHPRSGIVEGGSFHDLGHTCATLLLTMGLSPKVAQERFGHSDVSVTMGIYSHVTPETRREAARVIESSSARWIDQT